MPWGNVMLWIDSQYKNAYAPILLVTPSGITTAPPSPQYFFKTPFSTIKSLLFVVGLLRVLIVQLNYSTHTV